MSSLDLSRAKGFLCDLDGVLYVGRRPIEGAVETIRLLRSRNIPFRFLTNTSTRSIESLHRVIREMGFPIEKSELFSSVRAGKEYLSKLGQPGCHFLLAEDTLKDFESFPMNNIDPEFVVVGDIGDAWTYQRMNEAFNMLVNGAELIAMHKGRFWQTPQGLKMDEGAFVVGLEYCSGKTARVMGKPSRKMFELALEDMGLAASDVAMIGDDLINDIQGAQQAGIAGVLVRTGKYRKELVAASSVKPDLIIDSINSLPALL